MGDSRRPQNNRFIQILKKYVLDILKDEEVRIVLFGSRARGGATTVSDVDIGLIPKGKVDKKKIVILKELVEELNIPYKVDIIDFSYVSEELKKEALQEVEIWKD
jgi:predicted nucleotidyltransferase